MNLAILPKADLHVHLEGTVNFNTLKSLAIKNNIPLVSPVKIGEILVTPPACLAEQHFKFGNFHDFIGTYVKVSESICDEEDILYIAKEFFKSCKTQNIIHAEIYFSPTTFIALGKQIEPLLDGLIEAQRLGKQEYGMEVQWIFDVVRNSPHDPFELLKIAQEARLRGVAVTSIGLAGLEDGYPAKDFAEIFSVARGEFNLLAHAGETAGADSVLETITTLNPTRIGHGIRAIEDEKVVEILLEKNIPLEVCPWSNICLKITTKENHPILEMIDLGLNVVIASDDPGLFGKTLTDNYEYARTRGVKEEVLRELAERSLKLVTTL